MRAGAHTLCQRRQKPIWKLLSPIYLPSPKKEDWINIAIDFNEIWNFPNCVGAIDGKHISIICPQGAKSE